MRKIDGYIAQSLVLKDHKRKLYNHFLGIMIDPQKIIEARDAGELKYIVISDYSNDMNRVLSRFGLIADSALLVEHNRETALSILAALLWKDMAYESACMSEAGAKEMAEAIISQNESTESKYYSNGNWAKRESWNPLTDSTFDAGLIITGCNHRYFCIWFQDED